MNTDLIQTLKGEKVDEVLTKSFNEGLRQARLVTQARYTGIDSVIRALSTTGSAAGAEFLPTDFSPELVAQFRQALVTSSLFRHIPMPTKSYTLPVQGSPATAYLVPENTGNTGQTAISASTPGTANVTFTAHDLGALTYVSNDETEDSIIPMVPFIQENLIRGLAEGIEQAIINGDTTATHQDSDVTASSDSRKAWKGLRKYALANNYKVDISTFSLSTMRSMRKSMGKYGSNTDRLAWIVSNSAYNQMLSFAQVETMEKFGGAATVVNGTLERIDGIPVFVSPFMRQDLNASGVYDGTTTTKTGILLVHRDAFLVGNRQEMRQWKLVADMRLDFEPTYDITANPTVVFGYNLTA
jgi:HK97 family phage major capsid protein